MAELGRSITEAVPLVSYSDVPSSANETGAWKYAQPRYEDILPPCARRCPAGNDISALMALAAAGDLAGAARVLRRQNPLPAVLGRVCPHPCTAECNRALHGGPIAIPMVERMLGDFADRGNAEAPAAERSGRRVAVVGAGPAGITAAYLLALAGHDVEVFDDKDSPGGYLRTGIPDYRLPKSVLDRELELVSHAGVKFHSGVRVGRDVTYEALRAGHQAVVIAAGLHKPREIEIRGWVQHEHLRRGVDLLESIQSGFRQDLPRCVAVIGGGNTAIDAARSLLRLGVDPIVVYRRTRAEMPAIEEEVRSALEEGIKIQFLAVPRRVVLDGNRVEALECERMELRGQDRSGLSAPAPVPGSAFRIPVQGIVTAIGEAADLDFLPEPLSGAGRQGTKPSCEPSAPGLFFAGDIADGEGTVAAAVGSGRRAAAAADAYLRGRRVPARESGRRTVNHERVAGPNQLNPAYFAYEPAPEIEIAQPSDRVRSFTEVVSGFTKRQAQQEARRCLSCGTCNGCMNCYYFCPDVAIRKRTGAAGFEVDITHCKGCGICVEECPRGAMVLGSVPQ